MNSVTAFMYFGVPAVGVLLGWLTVVSNERAVRKLDREMAAVPADGSLVVEQHPREVVVRVRGQRSDGHVVTGA
jgi:hypothetical protein